MAQTTNARERNLNDPEKLSSAYEPKDEISIDDFEKTSSSKSPQLHQSRPIEEFLISFSVTDIDDPKNWPSLTKWTITCALSLMGFNRIFVSTMMAPAINSIASDLGMSNLESTMALSVYLLATAFGPLVIGPLSEIYGRRRVIDATNVWFLVWNLVCGFSNSKGLLIAARLLAGFGASAVYVIAYAVLADIWSADQRGKSLAVYVFIPLSAAALGPIVGAFITQYSTWHWLFFSTTILQAASEVFSLVFVKETYAPLLLRRKAVHLRTQTGDDRYHAEIETREQGITLFKKLRINLSRPLRLLAFHPIIQMQALISGMIYGLLYFVLTSYSSLFVSAYHQSVSVSGLHYVALFLGELTGSQVSGPLMDCVYEKLKSRAGGKGSPELRTPLLLPSLFLIPTGFILYGWAAEFHEFWLVVDIGAFLLSFGMQIFGTVLLAYVMDAYADHVSSATAATQLIRSLTAFGFPLFSDKLYRSLGYGWGNSLLAFISLILTLVCTAILWRYGAMLRARARNSY